MFLLLVVNVLTVCSLLNVDGKEHKTVQLCLEMIFHEQLNDVIIIAAK